RRLIVLGAAGGTAIAHKDEGRWHDRSHDTLRWLRRRLPAPAPVSPPAALSFLKETSAASPWTEKDVRRILNVSAAEASRVLVQLQIAGYVEETTLAVSEAWPTMPCRVVSTVLARASSFTN